MSISAINWAWEQKKISPIARLVLLALADRANEAGVCWPSNRDLRERAGCSERAVRKALRELEEVGAIVTQQRTRTTSLYHLQIGRICPEGAPRAPSKAVTPEHAEGASRVAQGGTPRGSRGHEMPPNHHRTIKEPSGRARARGVRPTSLPQDWQPSEEDRVFARRLGLDPDKVAERFRLHFRAKGTCYADWSPRWERWCLEDADGTIQPTAVVQPQAVVPVAAPECRVPEAAPAWNAVHARLCDEEGEADYRAWLRLMILAELRNGEAVIRLPSRFMCDHVRDQYGERVQRACQQSGLSVRRIDWQVAPQGIAASAGRFMHPPAPSRPPASHDKLVAVGLPGTG